LKLPENWKMVWRIKSNRAYLRIHKHGNGELFIITIDKINKERLTSIGLEEIEIKALSKCIESFYGDDE